ncbi:DNase I-like protein [Xylariomycetidae sp. FL0641]|nr:DNase I-like protein [Xylariomycetidae sp. FL0641]
MAPSLDLFVLTFNAAKHSIDVPVFVHHLHEAFRHNATDLPELVVLCLQELSPMAKAFIGSYVLSPYLQRFESAVNLAASQFLVQDNGHARRPPLPFTLMATRNVGMTAIMLFARDPAAVHHVQATGVGFGAGDMANKGAAGLRLAYQKDGHETELTFVSAHLAAFEYNLAKRNKNWESIVTGLVFEDPKHLTRQPSSHPSPQGSEDSDEAEALLADDATEKSLHDISIYRPGAHLFVAGDLNYRISTTGPAPDSILPDLDRESPNHFSRFLSRDQLQVEKAAGRTLHGLSEPDIHFPPTYKLVHKPRYPTEPGGEPSPEQNGWTWARHRWPGWCDRVLYLDIPWWARESDPEQNQMRVRAYDAMPAMRTSDHRPVFLRIDVPILDRSQLMPDASAVAAERAQGQQRAIDPRVKLPFPIDSQAWEHRAQVKKWEPLIGWAMLVSQSKQGIAAFITIVIVGLGAWWLRSQ